MKLLDHPLVQKYFGCDSSCMLAYNCGLQHVAYRILAAMQEPLEKTEKYLVVNGFGDISELTGNEKSISLSGFHPGVLRLPSRFQTPEKEPCSGNCDCGGPKKPTPDPVEVEINAIASPIGGGGVVEWKVDHLRKALHGLVQLARSTKEK